MSRKTLRDSVKARGFFRLQVTESKDGQEMIVGDTGWRKNVITNVGFQNFIVGSLGAIAASSQISYVGLGTGVAPAVTDLTLAGEVMASTQRVSVAPSAVSSKTAQFTAAFLSANSFVTTTYNISNVGLFAATTSNATLAAGNTYTSSLLNTNQNVFLAYSKLKHWRSLLVTIRNKILREFGEQLFESIPSRGSIHLSLVIPKFEFLVQRISKKKNIFGNIFTRMGFRKSFSKFYENFNMGFFNYKIRFYLRKKYIHSFLVNNPFIFNFIMGFIYNWFSSINRTTKNRLQPIYKTFICRSNTNMRDIFSYFGIIESGYTTLSINNSSKISQLSLRPHMFNYNILRHRLQLCIVQGVEIMYEAPFRVEDMIRSAWRHAELSRNDLTLAI